MTATDLARPSAIALAVVLGLIGGWVLAGSRDVPVRFRRVHQMTGLLFLALSLGALNRSRLGAVMASEDWTVIALRGVAIAIGACVLWMHARRHRDRSKPPAVVA